MFTVCPKCALTLVVTAADLRVAQGYVRCGRCSSVFNALARLTDERQPAAAPAESGAAPAAEAADPAAPAAEAAESGAAPAAEPADPATPAAEAAESPMTRVPASETAEAGAGAAAVEGEVIPEAALEFNPAGVDVTALFVEPAPDPQWTAATGSFKAMIAANPEGAAGEPAAAEATPPPPPAAEPVAEPASTPPAGEPVAVEVDAEFLAQLLGGARPDDPAGISPAAAGAPTSPAQRAAPAREPDDPRTATLARPRPSRPASPHPRPAQAAAAEAPPAARVAPATPPPPVAVHAADGLPEAWEVSGDADAAAAQETAVRSAHWLPHWLPHAWVAGAVLAVLLLLGQIINHYREQLAADARFNRPLTRLYAAFGVKLAPAWDLRAYDVRQLGASVDSASRGLITVRASVKNGARQPQPLPLLRVTLEDRFGNRLASRDVAPRFYLPTAVPASSLLASGQRVDAQMGFLDPGANAVGFEIDACLPMNGGVVTCANDVNAR
jgi:predicted Zn finger-like uncharacterized protein